MTWRGNGPDWLDADEGGYTFLVLAAFEARKERRRYWARDGPADRKYPPQPLPWWPAVPDGPDLSARPTTRRGQSG